MLNLVHPTLTHFWTAAAEVMLYPIQGSYAISPEDAGLDVTDELLNKYSDDPVCKTYAQIARQYIYSLRHGPKDSRGMLIDRNAKGMDGVKKFIGKIRKK